VEHLTELEIERRLRHLQELQRPATPSPAETAAHTPLPHTAPQTPRDTTPADLVVPPPAPAESPPAATGRAPKAKPQRTTRAKRSPGKAKTTSTARRPSRSK
jgi:hypothetical protein